jgi:hypothetical protein
MRQATQFEATQPYFKWPPGHIGEQQAARTNHK